MKKYTKLKILVLVLVLGPLLSLFVRPVIAAPEDVAALQDYCQATHSYNLTDGRDAEIICLTGDQGNVLNDNQIDVLWGALTPEEQGTQLTTDGCNQAYAGSPDLIQACLDLQASLAAQAETCEERSHQEGFPFGWIVCSIINGVGGAIQGIFNWILGLDETTGQAQYCNLEVNLEGTAAPGAGETPPTEGEVAPSSCASFDPTHVQNTWNAFRVLANVFFVIAFIYAIYQVAFSNGNNAYLIRSMLPKLAVAVILVQLSYFLVTQLINVSNDLGRYVSDVFTWVFQGQEFDPAAILFGANDTSVADTLLNSALIGIGFIAMMVSFMTIASIVVTMLITVFLVLIARKLLILVFIVLAPLAAIAWIHPQTDGLAKSWWQIFSKLLLMYPLIILLIKTGELMARATSGTSNDQAFDMVRFIAFFIPFFLIPFTFRFAGGLIGQIGNFANNTSKGLIDRGKGVDAKRKEIRQNNARAAMQSKKVAGKRNLNPFRRARAGVTFDRLLYGPGSSGKLVTTEKLAGAMSAKDKINLLEESGYSDKVKAEAFRMRNFTPNELITEATRPGASDQTVEAAHEALANQRNLDGIMAIQDMLVSEGRGALGFRITGKKFSEINEIAPDRARLDWNQTRQQRDTTGNVVLDKNNQPVMETNPNFGRPNFGAIPGRPPEVIGKVNPARVNAFMSYARQEHAEATAALGTATPGTRDHANAQARLDRVISDTSRLVEKYAVAPPHLREDTVATSLGGMALSGQYTHQDLEGGPLDVSDLMNDVRNQHPAGATYGADFLQTAGTALQTSAPYTPPTPGGPPTPPPPVPPPTPPPPVPPPTPPPPVPPPTNPNQPRPQNISPGGVILPDRNDPNANFPGNPGRRE